MPASAQQFYSPNGTLAEIHIRIQWVWPLFKIHFVHTFFNSERVLKMKILKTFLHIFCLCLADLIFLCQTQNKKSLQRDKFSLEIGQEGCKKHTIWCRGLKKIFQKKYARKNLDPKTVFLEIYLGIVFSTAGNNKNIFCILVIKSHFLSQKTWTICSFKKFTLILVLKGKQHYSTPYLLKLEWASYLHEVMTSNINDKQFTDWT
jgi:hypothetical protein